MRQNEVYSLLYRLVAVAFHLLSKHKFDPVEFIAAQNAEHDGDENILHREFDASSQASEADLDTMISESLSARTDKVKLDLLLILDEARTLIDYDSQSKISGFRIFRKVWADLGINLWKKHGIQIFATLTDTTSRVANFLPASERDASGRIGNSPEPPALLFEPFYLVANFDIFADRNLPASLARAFRMIKMGETGRPLWLGPLLQSSQMSEKDRVDEGIELAIRKILGGIHARDLAKYPNDWLAIRMACLGLRISLKMHSFGVLAETLPSRNMRYITHISESRDSIQSMYPSDPFLSYAASVLMTSQELLKPSDLLIALRGCIEHKLVDIGNIGELVQQFFYIIARDSVVFGLNSVDFPLAPLQYPIFTVKQLLHSLHREAFDALSRVNPGDSELQRLMSGKLSFSHFTHKNFTPNKKDILKSFLRAEAIVCMPGQAGIDLIIPVLLAKRHTPSNVEYGGSKDEAIRGIKRFNDNSFTNSCTILKAVDGAAFVTDEVDRCEPETTSKLWDSVKSTTADLSGQADEIDVNLVSFILIQVKNRIKPSKEADSNINPYYAGIFERKQKLTEPFLAIRHEMRFQLDSVEIMESIKGGYGLVLGEVFKEQFPFLTYREKPSHAIFSREASHLIQNVRDEMSICKAMNDRIPLAFGAAVNTFKVSPKLIRKEQKLAG
jgi:hypothetical protein